MGRRGRPPHPDILTPREWQVLSLLREGLSNPEIAERLGISRDGVKFHVSEILTKLGVASREEAASWSVAEIKRPWWMAALVPLGLLWRKASWALGGAVLVAAVAGLVSLAFLVSRGRDTNYGEAEDDVWQMVVSRTSTNLFPILRPTYLPSGFSTVKLIGPPKTDSFFAVEYKGSDRRLEIAVGKYNPPPALAPANSEAVDVRGQTCDKGPGVKVWCFLRTEDENNPRAHLWLVWSEPGRWRLPGFNEQYIEYSIFADGLTKEEVLRVAEGLAGATSQGPANETLPSPTIPPAKEQALETAVASVATPQTTDGNRLPP